MSASAASSGKRYVATTFFRVTHDPSSNPLGTIMNKSTALHLQNKHHPFHIRAHRQIANFDRSKLHIAIRTPGNISKSSLIRDSVTRRIRSLLSDALKEKGWRYNGTRRLDVDVPEIKQQHNLSGCFLISVYKEPGLISAPAQNIRECCKVAREFMIQSQSWAKKEQDTRHARSKTGSAGE